MAWYVDFPFLFPEFVICVHCLTVSGSSLHALKTLAHPRWEDYTYDYVDNNPNGWIGDGWTMNEKNKVINVDYLDDDQMDFPPVACVIDKQ